MNKIKQSRPLGFTAIAIVYVIAAAVGVLVYNSLSLPWWAALLIADIAATAATFAFSVAFSNASVYDPYWSVAPPFIIFAFAIGRDISTLGVLMLIVISFWAVRLTANWAYTFRGLTHQDWRYTMLKEKTGSFYPFINFLGIHIVPTLVVYACILPAVHTLIYRTELNIASFIFLAVSLLAALMQGAADIQMHKYRKKKTCTFIRCGFWKYSRHPNYLGEILMWWGVGMAAFIADTDAWYLLAGAVLNTALFLAVSIPMADRRQSQKPGFDEYKRQTHMLLPIKK